MTTIPQEISDLLQSMNGASDTDEAWEIAKYFGIEEISFPEPSDFAVTALDGSVWLFVSLGTGWEVKPTTMASIAKNLLDRIEEPGANWVESIPASWVATQPEDIVSGQHGPVLIKQFGTVLLKDNSIIQRDRLGEFHAYPAGAVLAS